MLPRAFFLLPVFVASGLGAAEPEPFTLGTIVVTAYADQPAVDAHADVLKADTIRQLERMDLAEALRLSPGVTMSNTGPRNEAGVNVRGFDLRQTPVFIDGAIERIFSFQRLKDSGPNLGLYLPFCAN